uniref:Uncharacterized protein n=1 Tax=Kalanchoe fedtschenkoi TaxID=63787 RepID=A0A7N0TH13_KALFE
MDEVKEFLQPDSMEFQRVFSNGSGRHVAVWKHCFDKFRPQWNPSPSSRALSPCSKRRLLVSRSVLSWQVLLINHCEVERVIEFVISWPVEDRDGIMAHGAIFNQVDEIDAAAVGQPMSVPWTCLYHIYQDELEITSKLLGLKGSYSRTAVLLHNKTPEEIVANQAVDS